MAYSELAQLTGRLMTEFKWLHAVKFFDKVDSTQNRILQWLPKTGEGAVVVLAESQSKGTGRQGRPWVSPPGGVWMTLALPLKNLPIANAAPFSMVSALCVLEALKDVNNLDSDLKWPNDIQVKGKKVAGILLTTTAKYKQNWLLIGVGVNVNNELPADLAATATSIKQIRGQSQGRTRLVEAILASLWAAWQEFDRTGFGPYQKSYEGRLTGVGKPTSIAAGSKTVKGTILGIDPQGGLLIKSGANTQTIHAGEIVG